MSDAVIVADVQGRFVAVNAAARALSDTYDPLNPEGWAQHFEVYRADGRTGTETSARRRTERRLDRNRGRKAKTPGAYRAAEAGPGCTG